MERWASIVLTKAMASQSVCSLSVSFRETGSKPGTLGNPAWAVRVREGHSISNGQWSPCTQEACEMCVVLSGGA